MKQNSMTRRGGLRVGLAVAFAMTLGGCASTVRIGDLLAEPQRYAGQTVQVEGTVTRSAGILGVGGYEVDDGTGQIFVVAQGTVVPAQGSRTKAKGTFEPVFSFGGRNIAAILQSGEREE
jgi:hypothetical protein